MSTVHGRKAGRRGLRGLVVALAIGAVGVVFAVRWLGLERIEGGRANPASALDWAAEPDGAALPALRTEIAELRRALDEERSARGALALELGVLRGQVERALGAPAPADPGGTSRPEPPAGDPPEGAPTASTPAADEQAPGDTRPWFDDGALLATGVPAAEVERLRELWAEVELEKLYLRDEAAREGAPHTRRRIRELEAEVRTELGETGYDRLLYATGRINRVMISDVLSNSPAADAGLQAGDLVLRYAGDRVFGPSELKSATRGGESGERIRLEVLRGEQTLSVSMLRGPLGVRLKGERRTPGSS